MAIGWLSKYRAGHAWEQLSCATISANEWPSLRSRAFVRGGTLSAVKCVPIWMAVVVYFGGRRRGINGSPCSGGGVPLPAVVTRAASWESTRTPVFGDIARAGRRWRSRRELCASRNPRSGNACAVLARQGCARRLYGALNEPGSRSLFLLLRDWEASAADSLASVRAGELRARTRKCSREKQLRIAEGLAFRVSLQIGERCLEMGCKRMIGLYSWGNKRASNNNRRCTKLLECRCLAACTRREQRKKGQVGDRYIWAGKEQGDGPLQAEGGKFHFIFARHFHHERQKELLGS